MISFRTETLEQLPAVAASIAKELTSTPVALLRAEMGSGKTTLILEIIKALGSRDTGSSPTFSMVNEYIYGQGRIFHFDLYRVKDQRELWDIGFEEYIDSGEICLIEWPEIAEPLLSGSNVLDISIEKQNEDRIISIETIRL